MTIDGLLLTQDNKLLKYKSYLFEWSDEIEIFDWATGVRIEGNTWNDQKTFKILAKYKSIPTIIQNRLIDGVNL